MTSLLNIAAVLAFAAVVAAAVAAGLRLLIPSEPYRPPTEALPKGRKRFRWLLAAVGVAATFALLDLAFEIRFAYGAPYGERDAAAEVVEVGECDGPGMVDFGLARSCELRSYRVDGAGSDAAFFGSIDVVGGGALRPGDQVARYTASGWRSAFLLGANGSHWYPVEAEERPGLVWLPTAALVAAAVGWRAVDAALRRGRSS